jgi:hypothetical protein
MNDAARPTLRCLTKDLNLPLPPADEPLDEISHPLLAKVREQFADPATGHERIRAIDDETIFKAKVQRWRGAVWVEETQPWVIAAGTRSEGSQDDFYAQLEAQAGTARAQYNARHSTPRTGHTYVGDLLPNADDRDRYLLEAGSRLARRLTAAVRDLTRGSLHDGHEHAADFPAFRVGIVVRADDGHATCAAVRVTGSVPTELVAMLLRSVPGCDPTTWYPEYALPERDLLPAEQAWSTVMDPQAAAKLLDQEDR